MEWNEEIDLSKRKMTSKLIIERALARGWKVAGFETVRPLLMLEIPGRADPVMIYSAAPPQMSYTATKIAKDKHVTSELLRYYGMPVPEEMLVPVKSADKQLLADFLDRHPTVVVKPLDASHGKGITVGVTSPERLEWAIGVAAQATKLSKILVQQQVQGVDVRIVCIDYQYVDAITREPAFVVGDGVHTIRELVDITNASGERAENYRARLNIIPPQRVADYLSEESLNEVPPTGKKVQTIGVSNVGMGGESHNIRQDIPEFMREAAVQAARLLKLPVCGVDFMVPHVPVAGDTAESLPLNIIEVNECPMLTMYEDVRSSEQMAVIDRYLDFVAQY